MTTNSLFNELETLTKEHISYLENNVITLNEEQLSFRLRPESWNVREIIAHINEFAVYYHSAFSKKIDTTIYQEPKETFISSPLGKSMWNTMKLGNANNVKRKMKALKMYNPTFVQSIVTENVIQDFVQSQRDLLHILDRSKAINIRKAKIKLLGNTVIRFRFGDTLLYVIYHNQRHIQQIKNLISHAKFPK